MLLTVRVNGFAKGRRQTDWMAKYFQGSGTCKCDEESAWRLVLLSVAVGIQKQVLGCGCLLV
jgi:hypothetical protein